ncbi:MAG: ATP-binding cassette domain-containing protein [FCB group bacterium]|jgi:ATP-binding cassette subfamily F protein uup|nr:ATP-binding cassette domain-containing protein [FCB group bacterium]
MSVSKTTDPLLNIQSVWKNFGAQPVLKGVSLTVHEGDRMGFIGRNGTGKSTLLKIMSGVEDVNEGAVIRRQGLRLALLRQHCTLDPALTVGEALDGAHRQVVDLLARYHAALDGLAHVDAGSAQQAKLAREVEVLHHELDIADGWNLDQHIRQVSAALGLPPPDRRLATLSGGELRRVDLAATLLTRPDMLLLDEPTNHIDIDSIEWMERFLAGYAGSCVLVTHDRYFLERVANRIIELEFGHLNAYRGNYDDYLEQKSARLEREAQAETSRQAIMRRELAWVRRGAKARSTKQKARIQRFDELVAQGPPERHNEFAFEIPSPRRLGKSILEAEDVSKSYGGKVLFRNVSLLLTQGMRVGIVGPNGSGKTTLLRVLMGLDTPDTGKVVVGESTEFLYADQSHEEVDPETTILQHVSNGNDYFDVDSRRIYVPTYLERFLFDRAAIHMPMKNLSGGERNRIDLAKKLLRGGNVLVFDEPTNDLDLPTLRVLEESIENHPGCAIMVSHDRFFLDRLCTHMLVFEEEEKVVQLAGNYEDYLAYRQRIPIEAPKPEVREVKPARRERAERPRKLTYMEKKELEGIEGHILAAEAEVGRLEALANDPAFFQGDYRAAQEGLAAIAKAKERVAHLYERWAELEKLAE